ncbi:MAG TPA: hypothetical protein VLC09_00530, partial [Polyangiaceae bacterium]|nr:hypothetical protein [Polyangiaceae bacterium]
MSRVRHDWAWIACLAVLSCTRAEPPGAESEPTLHLKAGAGPDASTAAASTAAGATQGGPDDHLPFEPTGEKLASIAWRTWIYTDTGPNRTRLGYLRAGAVVDARGPAIVNSGCEGGWYRINPRGFVCVGKGATTDPSHPMVTWSSRRPVRGQGFPYVYAMSDEPPPHRYFRLPDKRAMSEVEGAHVLDRGAAWLMRARETSLAERLDGLAEPPDFLTPTTVLEKPYGTKSPLRTRSAAGQAARGSGFALAHTFAWNDRAFGLSTELDVLPLDRLVLHPEQSLAGVVIPPGHAPEVAFHVKGSLTVWKRSDSGGF